MNRIRLLRRLVVFLASGLAATAVVGSAHAAPGDLDPSFGTGGLVTTTFTGLQAASPSAAAIHPDGAIVVTGYATFTQASPRIAVAQYESDGSHDLGFSTDGRTILDSGVGSAAAALPDGRTVVSGYLDLGDPHVFVARLNADGSLDASFSGGLVEINVVSLSASGLAVQADGRIVVGTNQGVIRLEEDGDPDPT